jgi:dihydroorotate dehydrogenase
VDNSTVQPVTTKCTYYLTDQRVISHVAVQQRQGGRGVTLVNTFVGAYKVHKKVNKGLNWGQIRHNA